MCKYADFLHMRIFCASLYRIYTSAPATANADNMRLKKSHIFCIPADNLTPRRYKMTSFLYQLSDVQKGLQKALLMPGNTFLWALCLALVEFREQQKKREAMKGSRSNLSIGCRTMLNDIVDELNKIDQRTKVLLFVKLSKMQNHMIACKQNIKWDGLCW